ncbi:hypothetical protein WOLCODRAFT_74617, partial [Wolfiporia cocos MD-104 SS10]
LSLLLLVAAIDIWSIARIAYIFRNVYADEGTKQLRLGNPYIGLDALYKSGYRANTSGPVDNRLINRPRVVAPVYMDRPNKPTADDELIAYREYGTFSPHERHFQVDSSTATILQFRVIDFGMEDCALTLRLPGHGEVVEGRHPFRINPSSILEVCRLDISTALDLPLLSWNTKPPCSALHFPSVLATGGQDVEVARFPCEWGSYHSFEVSCDEKTPGCFVDIWSSQNQTWGMFRHKRVLCSYILTGCRDLFVSI